MKVFIGPIEIISISDGCMKGSNPLLSAGRISQGYLASDSGGVSCAISVLDEYNYLIFSAQLSAESEKVAGVDDQFDEHFSGNLDAHREKS